MPFEALVIVRLNNVCDPVNVTELLLLIVTVPPFALNVPPDVLNVLEFIAKLPDVDVNVPPDTVNVPFIVMLLLPPVNVPPAWNNSLLQLSMQMIA